MRTLSATGSNDLASGRAGLTTHRAALTTHRAAFTALRRAFTALRKAFTARRRAFTALRKAFTARRRALTTGLKILTLLCSVLLLHSCSNPGDDHPPRATTPQEPQPQIYTVEIKDMKFVPDSLVVKKGDKVIFVNRDIVNHCVTEETKAWTSSPIPGGEDWMLVVQKSSNYYCAIHLVMKGKIIVK